MYILIDKEKGLTSHDVVRRLRTITGENKIGHAGTLDPNATGLLIVGIGRDSTKKLVKFLKLDKEYFAEIVLGEERDTDDVEGKILFKDLKPNIPTKERVESVLRKIKREKLQTPPRYSAVRVKGKKAYNLARLGKKVDLKPRYIIVYDAELLSYRYPIIKVRFSVSSGTYIRSIARDIGRDLRTYAYLGNLIRSRIGSYDLALAQRLKDISVSNWKDKCI